MSESTELDRLIGDQPEDVVAKKYPVKDRGEDPAYENSRTGGNVKLPEPPTPFKIGG